MYSGSEVGRPNSVGFPVGKKSCWRAGVEPTPFDVSQPWAMLFTAITESARISQDSSLFRLTSSFPHE